MRKFRNVRLALAICLALVGSVLLSGFQAAEARPQNRTQFIKQYPKVKENNPTKMNCLICHEPKEDGQSYDTKKRNNYGQALMGVIEKNEKDGDKIAEALKKIEKEDSAIEGKTFGDLLKEGKLPASKE